MQPTLRQSAVATLRHLSERDSVYIQLRLVLNTYEGHLLADYENCTFRFFIPVLHMQ